MTREITWASKFIPAFTQGDLQIFTTITKSVLKKSLHRPACDIIKYDNEMEDDEVTEYLKYPSILPTIDGNAIVNNMTPPLAISPLDTLVKRRLVKSIRAHVFDHGSQSSRRSRTLDIPRSTIQYLWIDMIKQQQKKRRKEKIAIFTSNRAIVLTAESCQGLIQRALNDGPQTHAAGIK